MVKHQFGAKLLSEKPKIYFNSWFMLIMLSRKPGSGGHIGSQSCLFSSFSSAGCHREATTKGWHFISTPTYKPRAFWIPCTVIYVHNRTYIYTHMYLIIYTYYIINGKVISLYARCLIFVQCESTCFSFQATVVAEREAMVAVAEQAQPRFETFWNSSMDEISINHK